MAQIAPLHTLVRPWLGKPITEPGIYSNVPMDRYHSNELTEGPSVSHSVLWQVEKRSAKHAYAKWHGNPNRKPEGEAAPHLSLGRAIHHLAAGEAQFAKHFVVRPSKWDSWRTDAAKAWRGEQTRLNMGVLTPEDVDAIQGVAASLNEHPTIQAGILRGLVEMTIVWRDPVTGIWVKSRPDMLPLDSRMIADLKSTGDASLPAVTKRNDEFGHPMQLAIADEGLWQVAGFEATDHTLVFVETGDPYAVNVKPIPFFDIEWGRNIYRKSLNEFASCLASGHWNSYRDDDVEAGFSARYRDVLRLASERGELPIVQGRTPRPDNASDGEAI